MTPKAAAAPVSSLAALTDHVVIIVKENHTYDNYFGTFPNSEGDSQLARAQNPPPNDPNHRHEAWMARANDQTYMVQYNQNDIPTYFALAEQYTICDHYFSEVAGPSTPNHLMLIAADSPVINNPKNMYHPTPGDAYNLHSLPAAIEKAGMTWGNYGGYAFHYIAELAASTNNHTRDLFLQNAAAGTLPSVSWVYGDGRPPYSEHPLENVTAGSEWTGQVIDSIVTGGLWPRTIIFVTWDDWGGLVRPRRSSERGAVEQQDGAESERREPTIHRPAVSLRITCAVPGNQPVCQERLRVEDTALPHQSGEVLPDPVRHRIDQSSARHGR